MQNRVDLVEWLALVFWLGTLPTFAAIDTEYVPCLVMLTSGELPVRVSET
jgi:hypothetical protein